MHAGKSGRAFGKTVQAKVEHDVFELLSDVAKEGDTSLSAVARDILTAAALGYATSQTLHEEVMSLRAMVLWLLTEVMKDKGKTAEEISERIKKIDEARFQVARHRAQEATALRG